MIVDDGSDDPYEWILINKEGIFRVEEDGTVGREVGVKIFPSVQYRLSYEKAMQLLPGKDDLLLGKTSNAFPSKDPRGIHKGLYLRIAKYGEKIWVPLKGNPTLEKK